MKCLCPEKSKRECVFLPTFNTGERSFIYVGVLRVGIEYSKVVASDKGRAVSCKASAVGC